jgi:NADH-ubiquinone oxidoreductase chain 5
LVTAGVYLLLRSSPILEYGSTPLIMITWLGALTAFFAATTGLLQNDLKRVIAYSTISQMGYLVLACGLSQYQLALFHLVNHAFFKALLFLAAGAIIHALNDEQDLRKMGGLVSLLPFTYTMFLIGSFSLIAVPFLTGYYSKELIILIGYSQYVVSGHLGFWLTTVSAILTAIYSTRLLYLAFLGYPNGWRNTYNSIHEAPLIMAIPLVILAIFSLFFGFFAKDLFVGIGSDFFGSSLFTHPNYSLLVDTEFGLSTNIKLLPLLGTILGIFSVILVFVLFPILLVNITNYTLIRIIYRYLNQAHFFDNLFTNFISKPFLTFGYVTNKVLDKGVFELLGPYGFPFLFYTAAYRITSLDSGHISHFAMFLIFGVFLFISSILVISNPKYLILFLITLLFL